MHVSRALLTSKSTPSQPLRAGAWGMTLQELAERGLSSAQFTALHRPWLWDEAGPVLSRAARELLSECGLTLLPIRAHQRSVDGSTKLVFDVGDGAVECVHMPRSVRTERVTLCISSQVGCAMGCTFCATASMGFRRHLSAGEIVVQVLSALRALGPRHPGQLTLVFMGMGEPLHNAAAVKRAIELLCEPEGLGLSARRITVSTSGLVPEIAELGTWTPRPLLAISLNATTDAQRQRLMPIARRYSVTELCAALASYPLRARERITVEYVLLAGVNDSLDDARRLAELTAGFPNQINLIPFNEHAGSEFRAPSEDAVNAFARAVLQRRVCVLSVRRSRGRDVAAACGQLVQLKL